MVVLPLAVGLLLANSASAAPSLRPPALQRLDTGAVKPAGWLMDELTLQAKGMSGFLPYFWRFINGSEWMAPKGSGSPHQYVPYYIRGLMPLSFMVEDENLVSLRKHYTDYILDHQNMTADGAGWLGPPIKEAVEHPGHGVPAQGVVSKYWAIQALESVAEGDPAEAARITAAIVANNKQFYAQFSQDEPAMNASKWGFARYSDAIVGLQWLLDRGVGEGDGAFLWDLMDLIRTQSDGIMTNVSAADGGGYDWETWFEEGDPFAWGADGEATGAVHLRRHGVDIGEAMKTGALWWRVSGSERDFNNPWTALQWGEKYLHMSDGMYFADEEVTYLGSGPQPHGNFSGGHTAGRGTETCSIVETMQSMRFAYEITGNVTFMDRLERLAFNSLPAALYPDVTANVYHHRSNQLSCGGQYGYNLFYCCSSNVHQGWPYFVLGQIHHQANGTLVISGFAPTNTTLKDGSTVAVSGSYPFSDSAIVTTSPSLTPTQMALRIPCWCESATVTVGSAAALTAPPCTHFHITVPAAAVATPVKIVFANKIKIYTWHANTVDGSFSKYTNDAPSEGAIEIHRGALTYALRPNSTVTSTVIGCIGGSPNGRFGWNCTGTPGGVPQFPQFKSRDVAVTTEPGSSGNWSYALLRASLKYEEGVAPIPKLPFDADALAPCHIIVQGRNLGNAGWSDPSLPPASPVTVDAPLETLVLVPFGSTNIRISVFPELAH